MRLSLNGFTVRCLCTGCIRYQREHSEHPRPPPSQYSGSGVWPWPEVRNEKSPTEYLPVGLSMDLCCHPAVTKKLSCQENDLQGPNYMVSQGRFELPTFPLGGGCSIQLSYWDK